MDQNYDKSPGWSLPQPSSEVNTPRSEQSLAVRPESAEARTGSVPIVPPATTSTPPAAPAAPPLADTDSATRIASSGIQATKSDDTDLIEKEWVIKAKQIVEQTKNDPHLQSRAMNKFKAEFMKQRYSRELKLGDE